MNERKSETLGAIDKMEALKEKGLVYFDVDLTDKEKEVAQEIKIEQSKEFDYFGPLNEDLIKNLAEYFSQLGKNSSETANILSEFVARMAEETKREFNAEWVWVNLRTTLPTHEYDLARWHKDGGYFQSDEEFYKFVFPIKGLPTRFAKVAEGKEAEYEKLQQEDGKNNTKLFNEEINEEEFERENTRIRKALILVVEEIESPGNEQAALYAVNNRQTSKIHSEPPMNNENGRIFLQVLPGPKEKIEEWQRRCEE